MYVWNGYWHCVRRWSIELRATHAHNKLWLKHLTSAFALQKKMLTQLWYALFHTRIPNQIQSFYQYNHSNVAALWPDNLLSVHLSMPKVFEPLLIFLFCSIRTHMFVFFIEVCLFFLHIQSFFCVRFKFAWTYWNEVDFFFFVASR